MYPGHHRERPYGIRYYRSSTPGIGGRLRTTPEDFRVIERHDLDPAPLDADSGDYGYLLVEATLRDWDTHRFASALADRLGTSRERIAWAGTKDATAVTTQLVSIAGVDPERLPTLADVDLEPIGRFGRQLEFGDHVGNRFEIVVRDTTNVDPIPSITDELTDPATGEVRLPNWFGPQRFGIRRPITHVVGRALVRDDPRDAVLTYIAASSQHEPDRTRAFREFVSEVAIPEDAWNEALDRVPGYLDHERTMTRVLADAGVADETACRRALGALPWSLRRLFVHAVQSIVFNEIVSERVRRDLPLDEPIVGDVICMRPGAGHLAVDRPQRVDRARLPVAKRHCRRGRAAVTAPLVGAETMLAGGEPGAIERAVLDHRDLAPTDFERLDEDEHAGSRRAVAIETGIEVERDPVTFRFELPPGAYATVVLREYTKIDPLRMV